MIPGTPTRGDEVGNWIDELSRSDEQAFSAKQEAQVLLLNSETMHPKKMAEIALRRA